MKKVFVGVSGGVDSSVAALRLKRAGYDVTGVFIKVWQPPGFPCTWEKERLDAMRVCAVIDIPFLTCDAADRYKTDVVDYLIREYRAGRTPNPDVMCNKHVKFGTFLEFAQMHGADYIATGHYAQVKHGETPLLLRGRDIDKDQSYFLWTLTERELSRTLFPIGESEKQIVRKEAAAVGLPTATKPDSQGICFLGAIDMKEFLLHFLPREVGVVEDEAGTAVGTHDGVCLYTLGQRHGFTVTQRHTAESAYYVIAKDLKRNVLVVSHTRPTESGAGTFSLRDTNWLADPLPADTEVMIRYRQTPFPARVISVSGTATVQPAAPFEVPAEGQSCVVYQGDRCLGGGIVSG